MSLLFNQLCIEVRTAGPDLCVTLMTFNRNILRELLQGGVVWRRSPSHQGKNQYLGSEQSYRGCARFNQRGALPPRPR